MTYRAEGDGRRRRLAVLVSVSHANRGALDECLGKLAQLDDWDISIDVIEEESPFAVWRATCRQNVPDGADVLLLDAGCLIERSAIAELIAVAELHERHSVVMPRSNVGGVCRVPLQGPQVPAAIAHSVWESVRGDLPRYQVVPRAEEGCVLIRSEVLAHFPFTDEDGTIGEYSLRINRYGYSTVLANWSFVPAIDVAYEADAEVSSFVEMQADPVDYFAHLTLPHRPRILYDLTHVAPHHYGTADFALNLLRDLQYIARDEFDVVIDIQAQALEFFRAELHGYELHRTGQQYDLAFKPTHINSWDELEHVSRLAPRIAYTVLDAIAVRCGYLSFPGKELLFRRCAELSDAVFALSEAAAADFCALTGYRGEVRPIHLATHFGVHEGERAPGEYVLVMGNSYAHKALREAASVLECESLPTVVMGLRDSNESAGSHMRYLESGNLTPDAVRSVLLNARVLVYPSHYEGFGLPILDALALGKPVIALDHAVNRELVRLTRDENLHLVARLAEMPKLLRDLWGEESLSEAKSRARTRHWADAAQEYASCLIELLRRGPDVAGLKERWEFLRVRRM